MHHCYHSHRVPWMACALFFVVLVSMQGTTLACMELSHVQRDSCPPWSYSGSINGPDKWGSLCSEYATCSSGKRQSPINILSNMSTETDFDTHHVALVPHYYLEHNVTLSNNGHTLMVSNFPDAANTLKLPDGTTYTLLQFHFHDSSEHLLDGKSHPLELHLVHNSSTSIAVLGFFFDIGNTTSPLISELMDQIRQVNEANEQTTVPLLELQRLISQPFSFYSYNGSFTTPPCTENVKWFISTTVLTATSQQVNTIAAVMGINSRPTQLSNSRPVVNYHFLSSSPLSSSSSPATLVIAVVFGLLLVFVLF